MLAYLWLPYMVLPIYAGFERAAGLAARRLGSTSGRRPDARCRSVVLPMLFPAIAAGSIFTFSLSLGDYIAVQIVGGKTQTLGNVIYGATSVPATCRSRPRSPPSRVVIMIVLPAGDPPHRRAGEPLMLVTPRARLGLRVGHRAGARVPVRAADRHPGAVVQLVEVVRLAAAEPQPDTGGTRRCAQRGPAPGAVDVGQGRPWPPRRSRWCSARLAAFAVQRYRFFGRKTVRVLLVLPIALPGIVTGIALNAAFQQAGRRPRLRSP